VGKVVLLTEKLRQEKETRAQGLVGTILSKNHEPQKAQKNCFVPFWLIPLKENRNDGLFVNRPNTYGIAKTSSASCGRLPQWQAASGSSRPFETRCGRLRVLGMGSERRTSYGGERSWQLRRRHVYPPHAARHCRAARRPEHLPEGFRRSWLRSSRRYPQYSRVEGRAPIRRLRAACLDTSCAGNSSFVRGFPSEPGDHGSRAAGGAGCAAGLGAAGLPRHTPEY